MQSKIAATKSQWSCYLVQQHNLECDISLIQRFPKHLLIDNSNKRQKIMICLFNHFLGCTNTNSSITKLGDYTVAKQHKIYIYTVAQTFQHIGLPLCRHVIAGQLVSTFIWMLTLIVLPVKWVCWCFGSQGVSDELTDSMSLDHFLLSIDSLQYRANMFRLPSFPSSSSDNHL